MPGTQKRFLRPACRHCSDQSAVGDASGPDQWNDVASDAGAVCCRMATGVAGRKHATRFAATHSTLTSSPEFDGGWRMPDVGSVKIPRRCGILLYRARFRDITATIDGGTKCTPRPSHRVRGAPLRIQNADTEHSLASPPAAGLTNQTQCLYLGIDVTICRCLPPAMRLSPPGDDMAGRRPGQKSRTKADIDNR